MNLYFRDNFFSAGVTEILNDHGENIGQVDLKSAFGSALDVCGPGGWLLYSGGFPMNPGRLWPDSNKSTAGYLPVPSLCIIIANISMLTSWWR